MSIDGLKRNRLTTCKDHERVIAVCVSTSEAVDVHVVLTWPDTWSRSHMTLLPRDTEACESISQLGASIVCCIFALAADVIVARSRIVKTLIRRMSGIHAGFSVGTGSTLVIL